MGQKWSSKVMGNCPEKKPSWTEVNDYYRQLVSIDQRYSQFMKHALRAFLEFRLTEVGKSDEMKKAVLDSGLVCLTGSCSDGGGSCRWFRYSVADIELDVMYEIGQVRPEDEDAIIEMIPEKPGFARLYNSPETFASLHPLLSVNRPDFHSQFNSWRSEQGFVNTTSMQGYVAATFPHRDNDGGLSRIVAALLQVDESELGFLLTEKVEGPSAMMELIVCLREDPQVLYSNDNVVTLKLVRWPPILNQWLHRDTRVWQKEKQHVVDACYHQGCHLVAKKSSSDDGENVEWRLSFSHMEKILMVSWNEHQKLCYYLLKSLYYRYLRDIEVDGKHIPSYALKTEMLWVVEQTKTSEWTEENLKKNATQVLKKLYEDLNAHCVANYFLPVMNIIDPAKYPQSLTQKVALKVKAIMDDLEEAIPKDLVRIVHLGQAILNIMNAVLAYLHFRTVQAGRKHSGREASVLEDALQAINYGVDVVALFQDLVGNKYK